MKIEHITDPAIIATILELDDPGLEANVFNNEKYNKAEWFQSILRRVRIDDGNTFRVYGVVCEGKIKGYMTAMKCVDPPVYNFFVIGYQTFIQIQDIHERQRVALDALAEVIAWAKENGCQMIVATAKNEKLARAYEMTAGFKRTEDITLVLEF
jgi:hypothetical protein